MFYLDIISLLYIFKFWISVDKKLLILSIINGLYNNVIFFRGILFELCILPLEIFEVSKVKLIFDFGRTVITSFLFTKIGYFLRGDSYC